MALNPQLYYTDLVQMRTANPFPLMGYSFDKMATAIALAMVQWGPTVQLQGLAVGTLGAGAIAVPLSKVIVPPAPPIVVGAMLSAGVAGSLGSGLGTVVGLAIPKTISVAGQYSGGVSGVGVGADVSKIIKADGSALTGFLSTQFLIFLGPGPANAMLAKGLGTGISKLLLAGGVGAGPVVGPPSISPGGGISKSVLV
jgi:hypothetical protein